MSTASSPSEYTWEVWEMKGEDKEWNEFVLREVRDDG